MDDKNDIKGEFSVLYHFLSYRPSFLYRFKIDKVNFLISTKRYNKFIIFFDNFFFDKYTVFNLKQYYRKSLLQMLNPFYRDKIYQCTTSTQELVGIHNDEHTRAS